MKTNEEEIQNLKDTVISTLKAIWNFEGTKPIMGALVIGGIIGAMLPVISIGMGATIGLMLGCYNVITK